VTFLNPAAEALTGWPIKDAAGKPLETVFEIINEETRRAAENPVATALREGVVVELANHTSLISRTGAEIPVEDSAAPIRDATGNIIGAVMVFHNVAERRKAERALREKEEFNRTVIESSSDSVKTLALDGTILWMSGKAQSILQVHDLAQFTGKSWVDLWAPEDRGAAREAVREAAEGGQSKFAGWYSVAGEPRYWDVILTPMLNDSGRPERLLAVSRDVTERQRLDELRSRLAAVIESTGDAVVTKTPQGIITTWNRGAERVFGYSAQEVIGKPVTILIPADRLYEEAEILANINRGTPVSPYETVRIAKDGTLLNVSLTVAPIHDGSGKVIGASKIARDITERKLADAERARLLVLEQQARAKAEEAEMRARFLAEASGELASSLDYEAALTKIARAAVPRIADWCVIHLVDARGIPRPLVRAHADPAKVALAEEIGRLFPKILLHLMASLQRCVLANASSTATFRKSW
jgi:PAS domain S-box-containing protein